MRPAQYGAYSANRPLRSIFQMLNLQQIRDGLATAEPRAPLPRGPRTRAGVAIVLAGAVSSPAMCFMQRVTRRGDRWSGDIAFPGGWAKDTEKSLREAAMRETHEEVGIHLEDSQHLGDVPPLSISRYKNEAGVIGASVFYVGTTRPKLNLDPREVADAFWIESAELYDPANRAAVHWSRSGPPVPRPAVEVQGRTIWGLTYRVLVRFSDLVLATASPLLPDPDA